MQLRVPSGCPRMPDAECLRYYAGYYQRGGYKNDTASCNTPWASPYCQINSKRNGIGRHVEMEDDLDLGTNVLISFFL